MRRTSLAEVLVEKFVQIISSLCHDWILIFIWFLAHVLTKKSFSSTEAVNKFEYSVVSTQVKVFPFWKMSSNMDWNMLFLLLYLSKPP